MTRPAAAMLVALALAWVGAALGTPGRAAAQQRTPVRAAATLSTTNAVLGERVRLIVTVAHPADVLVSVDPPARTPTLQLVEVVPRPNQVLGATGVEVTSRFEYVIAPFTLGETQLPPLLVAWLDADGETGEVRAAPPPLIVAATSAPDDTTLRPLKPQLDVAGAPPAWQTPAIAAGVAFAVLGVAGVLARRLGRRRAEIRTTPTPVEARAEGAARERLELLAADEPLARADYDAYYGTIANVVRDYLQERFGFNARALTTAELQRRMVALGVDRWQARLVSGLLDRCDAAVYAGRRPDPISADHDLTVAFEIVELSRPQEAALEPREAAGATTRGGER